MKCIQHQIVFEFLSLLVFLCCTYSFLLYLSCNYHPGSKKHQRRLQLMSFVKYQALPRREDSMACYINSFMQFLACFPPEFIQSNLNNLNKGINRLSNQEKFIHEVFKFVQDNIQHIVNGSSDDLDDKVYTFQSKFATTFFNDPGVKIMQCVY